MLQTYRIPLALVAAIFVFAGGVLALRHTVIMPAFSVLEQECAVKDATRCRDAINREAYHLGRLVSDWAEWDDTYAFVTNGNQDYITSNLQWQSLEGNTGVNMVLVHDLEGRLVWGEAYDSSRGGRLAIPELMTPRLPTDHFLLRHELLTGEITGLIHTEQGLMLISSQPVVRSTGQGPQRGVITMGRFLSLKVVSALCEQVGVVFQVTDLRSTRRDTRTADVQRRLEDEEIILEEDSRDSLTVHTVEKDIQGEPVLMVSAQIPRRIMTHGRSAIRRTSLITLFTAVSAITVLGCVLLLFGRHVASDHHARESENRAASFVAFLIPAAIGLVVAGVAFSAVRGWERSELEHIFTDTVKQRGRAFDARIQELIDVLDGLKRLHESSIDVNREEFHSFVAPVFQRFPEILAFKWAPRIPHSERAAFEQEMKEDGIPDFAIREATADGRVVEAGERDVYIPVRHVVAPPPAGSDEGLDLGLVPSLQEPLEWVRKTGQAMASPPWNLDKGRFTGPGIAVFLPVYGSRRPEARAEDNLAGYVLTIFHIGAAFTSSVGELPDGVSLRVVDEGVDASLRNLVLVGDTDSPPRLIHTERINCAGRSWRLEFAASDRYLATYRQWASWLVLVVFGLLTTWLTVYVAESRRRAAKIDRLVVSRTARLTESRHMLRHILNTIPVRVFWKDRQSAYLGCNELFAADGGVASAQDIAGLSDRDLAWSDFADELREEDVEVIETRRPLFGLERRITTADGTDRWTKVAKVPLLDAEDEVIGILGTYEEITDRKKGEEQQRMLEQQLLQSQKMEAIGQLAGGVAHDFNNLLTGITCNVSLAMMNMKSDDPVGEKLDEVNRIAKRAANLTRQLLAFSRRQIIQPEAVDLNETIRNLHKMLVRLIGEPIDLRMRLADDLDPIRIDPGQIEQIILNVCINARDAMPSGGQLEIATENVGIDARRGRELSGIPAGSYVQLEIADNGAGMTPEILEKVFEPFYTTKPVGKGTGLGLSTVYGAVKQNHGFVDIQSEPDAGTTFTIGFPRFDGRVESQETASSTPTGNECILYVEDDQTVRSSTVEVLRRLGYTVIPATNATDALRAAQTRPEPIDLLLTDVIMPGINGRELATRMEATQPELRVLFCSGYTADVIAPHGVLEEGMNFIEKPFDPGQLARTIRSILDRSPT